MKFGTNDNLLHGMLIATILILGGFVLFFATRYYGEDEFEKFFIQNTQELQTERSLQNIKEAPVPDALNVPILIYHSVRPHRPLETYLLRYYDVAPEQLEKQLRYLTDNKFTVIGFDVLYRALTQAAPLPPRPVILTFDDGWENQYQYAFPLLKKFDVTATFFIYTDPIDVSDHFLTWDQIAEMDDAGMTIAAHTRSHPYLVKIKDVNVLRQEIIGGKNIMEDRLGKKVNFFAYPFGHYNDKILEVVHEAGFKMARSTYRGIYHTSKDLFSLKGIEVTDDFKQFVKNLNGEN